MNQRQPFHIFAQVGDHCDHLKIGSVRLGRTLRAAAAIKRYTQATVFVAQAREVDGRWMMTATAERHYPVVSPSDADIQALHRQRAAESSAASLARHDAKRRRPRKTRGASR